MLVGRQVTIEFMLGLSLLSEKIPPSDVDPNNNHFWSSGYALGQPLQKKNQVRI